MSETTDKKTERTAGRRNAVEVKDFHHFRPRSRGGQDTQENLGEKPLKRIHRPYHILFGNLRPHEIIALLLSCWETVYPYNELQEPHTDRERLQKRIRAWDKLFGGECTKEEAIAIIKREFSQGHERLIDGVMRKLSRM